MTGGYLNDNPQSTNGLELEKFNSLVALSLTTDTVVMKSKYVAITISAYTPSDYDNKFTLHKKGKFFRVTKMGD